MNDNGGGQQQPRAPYEKKQPMGSKSPDQTAIVHVRMQRKGYSRATGKQHTLKIYLDGEEVTKISQGECCSIPATPGKHTLHGKSSVIKIGVTLVGDKSGSITFTAKSHQTVYFKFTYVEGTGWQLARAEAPKQ